jgi:hypothetical protein
MEEASSCGTSATASRHVSYRRPWTMPRNWNLFKLRAHFHAYYIGHTAYGTHRTGIRNQRCLHPHGSTQYRKLVIQMVKEFSACMEVASPLLLRKSRYWMDSALRFLNLFNPLQPFYFIHYHITFPSILRSYKWLLPLRVPQQNLYAVLIPPCVLHVHPSHSPHRPLSIDEEHNIRNS